MCAHCADDRIFFLCHTLSSILFQLSCLLRMASSCIHSFLRMVGAAEPDVLPKYWHSLKSELLAAVCLNDVNKTLKTKTHELTWTGQERWHSKHAFIQTRTTAKKSSYSGVRSRSRIIYVWLSCVLMYGATKIPHGMWKILQTVWVWHFVHLGMVWAIGLKHAIPLTISDVSWVGKEKREMDWKRAKR